MGRQWLHAKRAVASMKKAQATGKRFVLPVDVAVGEKFSNDAERTITTPDNVYEGWRILEKKTDRFRPHIVAFGATRRARGWSRLRRRWSRRC